MSIDERLFDLETAINNADNTLNETSVAGSASSPTSDKNGTHGFCGYPTYMCAIAVLIPVLTAVVMYYNNPTKSAATKKNPVKSNTDIAKTTAMVTAVGWVLLFIANYYGMFKSD